MGLEGAVEEGKDVLIECDIETVTLGDEALGGVRDGLFAGPEAGDVEAGVMVEFPAEEDFEKSQRFVKALGEAGEGEMGGEIGFCGLEGKFRAIAGEEVAPGGEAGEELALEIVVRGGGGVLLEGEALHAPVLGMKPVMEGEVILGDDAVHRFAEDGDISGGLGKAAVNAEGHVALDDAHAGEARGRQLEQVVVGPAKEAGIDGVYPERRVLPLDETVEGGAAAFWEMQVDERGGLHEAGG